MNREATLFDYAREPEPESKTRADQILEAFIRFHKKNPDIWTLFKKFTFKAIRVGREHYSANAIFELIRWHVDIETKGSEVKLSNNFRAYYARMFHAVYPEHGDFFRNRKRRSEDTAAYGTDVQVFVAEAPENEGALLAELARLAHETEQENKEDPF
jgi:hypothetical protein